MDDLLLSIHEELGSVFPDLVVSGFIATDLNVAERQLEADPLHGLPLRSAGDSEGLTLEKLMQDSRIVSWRAAIARSGLKASTYKSSVEQLARRFLKGEMIQTPLQVVNLYCAISARHLAPLGGYDLSRLPRRTIEVRLGNPEQDRFQPLGGRAEEMPIRRTIPVYASGTEILCWAFNHRDSAVTCLQKQTRTALFLGEALTETQRVSLEAALCELKDRLSSLGAGIGPSVFVQHSGKPRETGP